MRANTDRCLYAVTYLGLLYAVVRCCSTVCTCITQYCALRRHNSLKRQNTKL